MNPTRLETTVQQCRFRRNSSIDCFGFADQVLHEEGAVRRQEETAIIFVVPKRCHFSAKLQGQSKSNLF